MNGFLHQLADEMLTEHRKCLSEVVVVLPSHRASLFLRKQLAEKLDKPALAPEILTIESLVVRWSRLRLFNKARLLFELYEAYREYHSTIDNEGSPDTIDQFAKWGRILLQDFNEVDHYLVPAEELYRSLVDIRRIERWMPDGTSTPTGLMQKFFGFWDILGPLYLAFRTRLLGQGAAYQGLLYRYLCDDPETAAKQWPESWNGPLYMAGFNALSKAEEVLFDWLVKEKNAHLRWDADRSYLEKPGHEVGMFLRRFRRKGSFCREGELQWTGDHWSTTPKNIRVWATAKNMAQAQQAGRLLRERLRVDPELTRTALILANEDLLLPVLNALPAAAQHVNVTMGYPIRHGLVVHFLEQLLRHQEAIGKGLTARKNRQLYHRNVLGLITHPLWELLHGEDPTREVSGEIVRRNMTYFTEEQLRNLWEEKGGTWYDRVRNVLSYWDGISPTRALLRWAQDTRIAMDAIEAERSRWEREFLFQVCKVLVQLQELNERFGRINNPGTLRTFLKPLLQQQQLSFFGEPLQGLQIMGMLETRTLDFECVIVLSVNEEILPAGRSEQSFIPFDLRSHYGLPGIAEKNAIFAYHFYRLLQRANEIHLVHTTQTDDFGSGERSRYITQIEHELANKFRSVIHYREGIVTTPLKNLEATKWEIAKSPAVLRCLQELIEKGISPSALNCYLQTPLEFYFEYVLRLREVGEVEESLEDSTFGDVVHDALEKLYKPYEGKVLSELIIDGLIRKHEEQIEVSWRNKYQGGDPHSGQNYLGNQAAKTYVRRFLQNERTALKQLASQGQEMTLIACEKGIEMPLPLPTGSQARIHGTMDRVHRIGETVYVMDYKSGSIRNPRIAWDGWAKAREKTGSEKSIQLMIYSWLWHRAEGTPIEDIRAGIYWLRAPRAPGYLTFGKKGKKAPGQEDLGSFETGLATLIMEIMDREIPFANPPEAPFLKFSKPTGV